MPNITKHFHIDITPEQFLKACSQEELQELDLLLEYYLIPGFKEAQEKVTKALEENPNVCRECGYSFDNMVAKDLCVNCWEEIKGKAKKFEECYKTGKKCEHNCPGQCRESC